MQVVSSSPYSNYDGHKIIENEFEYENAGFSINKVVKIKKIGLESSKRASVPYKAENGRSQAENDGNLVIHRPERPMEVRDFGKMTHLSFPKKLTPRRGRVAVFLKKVQNFWRIWL